MTAHLDTLPLPADLYNPHPYVDNEFGECLGCGLDHLATCHLEQAAPIPKQGDPPA